MREERSGEKTMINVIVCRPGERAEEAAIEDDLKTMQEIVGGHIQEYFPFHSGTDPRFDDVALICNDEGKLMGLDPNRAICDEKGHVIDVIAGPFFLCFAPVNSETFLSLPEDISEKIRRKFDMPERFLRSENGIEAVKFDPKEASRVRER